MPQLESLMASRLAFGPELNREKEVAALRERWNRLRQVSEPVPASLLAALADLMTWLDAMRMPSMVIGGVAASVLVQPRLTQDIEKSSTAW